MSPSGSEDIKRLIEPEYLAQVMGTNEEQVNI
jgi:hypothetical protein